MTNFDAPFAEIERDFLARRVPLDSPGFYDHPNFMEVERANPCYLNNYARYVHDRQRTPAYDEHVRQTVPIVARVFHEHLKANGRLGACVDISGMISRALEMEGIWNFVVKGSLTIEFPREAKIAPKFFWSVDAGQFTAAHAWVVAPPYFIVDVAIRLQPYSEGEERYLPEVICSYAETLTTGTLDDVVSPEVRTCLAFMGIPKARQLSKASPNTPNFMKVFPARLFKFGETAMKFVPVATTAPDTRFQDMCAMLFDGKTGFELYASDVKAALAEARRAQPGSQQDAAR
ncbi:hypothetical protein [Rubrivivax gelatinosus]|uniref:Uncharacterized protein n=1 Tax=Rubrivivax gelatinosus (strain NBRC 100245 / IL144) TaxID=983917 RepID=I0HW34_RUBGI|nr:hypothetical protein [Rubrivivax gelatinosus]BAL97221.1 hypothetical protein RGE_38850 [Rubrivivax gelatinosus IL144]